MVGVAKRVWSGVCAAVAGRSLDTGKPSSSRGLTNAAEGSESIIVAGSPGRRVAGSPGRRVAGSPMLRPRDGDEGSRMAARFAPSVLPA